MQRKKAILASWGHSHFAPLNPPMPLNKIFSRGFLSLFFSYSPLPFRISD